MCRRSRAVALAGLVVVAMSAQAVGQDRGSASAPPRRTVTDMAGSRVALPRTINRIATLNSVPVINSIVMAFGEAGKIVNGLPDYASTPRYKYHRLFAPLLAAKPAMLGSNREPNLEELLKAAPDVAFTMDAGTAELLRRNRIPTVFLAWRQPEEIKQVMTLVGDVLDKPDVAADYVKYFDETLRRVTSVTRSIPRADRPRVLYCNLGRLTQEQLIGEWWIETAGGASLTNNGRTTEAFTFSLEQLFAWDPDILIVANPDDMANVRRDPRFKVLKAVKAGKVFVAPIAAHLWTNRTIEQPLTLLWAAHLFHPNQFRSLDLVKEVQAFYTTFFRYPMTRAQAQEILSGTL